MSGVFPVRREWQSRLQAITHVDGTARLQAVEPEMAPRLHALLEAYRRRGGMPVLLNTSFNLAGEPIVNRAVEGTRHFFVADRRAGRRPDPSDERASPTAKPKEEIACSRGWQDRRGLIVFGSTFDRWPQLAQGFAAQSD